MIRFLVALVNMGLVGDVFVILSVLSLCLFIFGVIGLVPFVIFFGLFGFVATMNIIDTYINIHRQDDVVDKLRKDDK